MVNGQLQRIAGHIQDVLTKIQSRLQWGSDKYDCVKYYVYTNWYQSDSLVWGSSG